LNRSGLSLIGLPLFGLLALGALTSVVVALAALALNPATGDLVSLCLFLLASGGLSLVVVTGATRLGWNRLLHTLRQKLLFALVLSSGLFAVNVGFTAYLMFISTHDLKVLLLLLLFSLSMSGFLAVAISRSFQSGLEGLVKSVRLMGAGNLTARASVSSGDELDELAGAFNALADRLETAFARQRSLEQARRQLVAAVSHDLRTPLATMLAMVASMNDGVVSDRETVRRYLNVMQSEIEYLSRLIDDLFELSQIDAGLLQLHPEQASLRDLISDTLGALSAQAQQRRLVLQGDVDERLPLVTMDTRRVQRVLLNLVQNAVRHTPVDGKIVIRALDVGSEVQVSVTDTGEGIAAEDLPAIFETFPRGGNGPRPRSNGGSGLGLKIARGIVELHGGRIWAESVKGRGATFTFALPKERTPTPA
jgi:signal transduction histidine kinase